MIIEDLETWRLRLLICYETIFVRRTAITELKHRRFRVFKKYKKNYLTVNPDSFSQVISVEAKPRGQHCHNFLFGLTFGPKQQVWPENYDNG
jgi:hypothetical protein